MTLFNSIFLLAKKGIINRFALANDSSDRKHQGKNKRFIWIPAVNYNKKLSTSLSNIW